MKPINAFINEQAVNNASAYGYVKPVDDLMTSFRKSITNLLRRSKDICVLILSSGATNDTRDKHYLKHLINIANENNLDIYNIAAPDVFTQISSVDELECKGPHISLNDAFDLFESHGDKDYEYCILIYDGQNTGDIPNEFKPHVVVYSYYPEGYKEYYVLDSTTKNSAFKKSVGAYYFPKQ